MDFSVIERHPWATTGIVIGGGFVLVLLLRRNSAPATTVVASGGGTNPQDAQLSAMQDQLQAQLSGLAIQGQTQLQLAAIGSDVQKLGITTGADVTNRQTDAQLLFGLGSLNAQIASQQIDAATTMKWIDAITAAFQPSGTPSGGGGVSIPPVTTQPYATPNQPISQTTPAMPVTILPTGGSGGTATPLFSGIVPGGTKLVPYPNLIPQGAWPDANIVRENVDWATQWESQTVIANKTNNFNSCLADAERSKGYPNYESLVSACHSNYAM